MAERGPRQGLPLRARLALWMMASAALSLATVAVTTYCVVSIEEREELRRHAAPETPAEIAADTAEEVLVALGIAVPIALLISVAGAVWISRRALAPLRAVVRAADAMTTRDLHRRLEVPTSDPELAELVGALNGLFERLELGFSALERHAADASHELRTPLAVLASELEVALRHDRSPAQWRQVGATALDEVRRLTRLVEALLALARIDAWPSADAAPFDLRDVIEQALAPIRGRAAAGGLSLAVEAGGDEPLVARGSAEAVASALANMLANAVDYSPAGGQVRLCACALDGGGVRIDVEDSGPGVPETERESIFEPFVRGRTGRATDDAPGGRAGGLGLGLATVRRVAERHGGSVTVGSSPLGGARFSLQLPESPSPPA